MEVIVPPYYIRRQERARKQRTWWMEEEAKKENRAKAADINEKNREILERILDEIGTRYPHEYFTAIRLDRFLTEYRGVYAWSLISPGIDRLSVLTVPAFDFRLLFTGHGPDFSTTFEYPNGNRPGGVVDNPVFAEHVTDILASLRRVA